METPDAMRRLLEASTGEDIGTVHLLLQEAGLEEIQKFLPRLVSTSSAAALRCLLENGMDPRPVPTTTLSQCNLEKFQLLREFGFNYKVEGHKILSDVVTSRATLDYLLDQGADINRSGPTTLTPKSRTGDIDHTVGVLNEAAKLGDTELFDYLVSRGADPARSLALHYACGSPEDKTQTMLDHLLTKYGDAFKRDLSASDEKPGLRDRGPRHRPRPRCSGTPWQYALYHKNIVALQYLLDRGAKPVPGRMSRVMRELMPETIHRLSEERMQAASDNAKRNLTADN